MFVPISSFQRLLLKCTISCVAIAGNLTSQRADCISRFAYWKLNFVLIFTLQRLCCLHVLNFVLHWQATLGRLEYQNLHFLLYLTGFLKIFKNKATDCFILTSEKLILLSGWVIEITFKFTATILTLLCTNVVYTFGLLEQGTFSEGKAQYGWPPLYDWLFCNKEKYNFSV